MTTGSESSKPGGICAGCGKETGAELLASSSGTMLCPACCDEEEGGMETLAADQLFEGGILSQLCQSCGCISPDLLTTADGLRLCADCYWKQESQRATVVPGEEAESDAKPVEEDFTATTVAAIEPTMPTLPGPIGPGTCEECGKGTLKRLPASDGRLLCERCVWEAEQDQSTLTMDPSGEPPGTAVETTTGTCEICSKTDTALVETADGRKHCVDCYIEQQ